MASLLYNQTLWLLAGVTILSERKQLALLKVSQIVRLYYSKQFIYRSHGIS